MSTAIKIYKQLFILIFVLSGYTALAQPPDFVVYFASGKADKITGGKVVTLKQKDKLFLTDKLNIGKSAALFLICKNGNIIKLKDSGIQDLSNAANLCSSHTDSFTSAYFHFIFDEFSRNDEKINEQNYLNNIGAISRGWPVMNVIADTINYLNGSINLTLRGRVSTGNVKVFDDPKATHVLKKLAFIHNSLLLDTLIKGLKAPGIYYWALSSTINQNSPLYIIKVMTAHDYTNSIAAVLKNTIETTPAQTAYMNGFLLEQNHFLVEAAKYYKQACMLDPENSVYKNTKLRFYE